jgi:hypothetical protein
MGKSEVLAGAERGLVVTDAPNWLVGKLLGGQPAEDLRVIDDPQGQPIGRFELEQHGLLGKAVGLLFAGGSAHASGRTHRVNVLGNTGEAQLRLTIGLGLLAVHDRDGKPIGEVRSSSRTNDKRTRAEFRAPRRRRFDLSKGGPLLASMDGEYFDPLQPQRPVRWQIVDASGNEVAVAEHTSERRNRLTIHQRLAEPLHMLVIAFGIAMFDRFWLQIPSDSGGGI